ncbi:MAG: hypothetical protein Kow0077_22740 [Anaerolineae bacterium]
MPADILVPLSNPALPLNKTLDVGSLTLWTVSVIIIASVGLAHVTECNLALYRSVGPILGHICLLGSNDELESERLPA